MALQTYGFSLFPMFQRTDPTNSGATSTLQINAANKGFAQVFQVPKTGTIDTIRFYVAGRVSNGDVDVSLQTLSSGAPSGTEYASSSSETVTVNTTGWFTATLATPASATRGDKIAARVQGAAATTIDATILVNNDYNQSWPYYASNGGAGWVISPSQMPAMQIGYDDGTWLNAPGLNAGHESRTQNTVNSTSTPRHIGVSFTPLFPMTVEGVAIWGVRAANSAGTIVLFTTDPSSPLATVASFDPSEAPSSSTYEIRYQLFTASYSLSAGTKYRIAYVPTGTGNLGLENVTVDAAAKAAIYPGGTDWVYTSASASPTAEGDWTDDTTKIPMISLIVSAFGDDAGGGAGPSLGNGGFA